MSDWGELEQVLVQIRMSKWCWDPFEGAWEEEGGRGRESEGAPGWLLLGVNPAPGAVAHAQLPVGVAARHLHQQPRAGQHRPAARLSARALWRASPCRPAHSRTSKPSDAAGRSEIRHTLVVKLR